MSLIEKVLIASMSFTSIFGAGCTPAIAQDRPVTNYPSVSSNLSLDEQIKDAKVKAEKADSKDAQPYYQLSDLYQQKAESYDEKNEKRKTTLKDRDTVFLEALTREYKYPEEQKKNLLKPTEDIKKLLRNVDYEKLDAAGTKKIFVYLEKIAVPIAEAIQNYDLSDLIVEEREKASLIFNNAAGAKENKEDIFYSAKWYVKSLNLTPSNILRMRNVALVFRNIGIRESKRACFDISLDLWKQISRHPQRNDEAQPGQSYEESARRNIKLIESKYLSLVTN